MLRVVIYRITGHGRSNVVCEAMAQGISRTGDRVITRTAEDYTTPEGDVAVFYGYTDQLRRVMQDYRKQGRAVYVDLGYWGRHEGGRRAGYHKISVNNRHPTAYFRSKPHKPDRFARFGIPIEPWKQGRHIIIAGMSAKAAKAEGFRPEQWERKTIEALRKVTDRPLIYRPKPNWKNARPLEGAGYSAPGHSLESAFLDCHAVVTHHSNVAVDAILSGVHAMCWDGVATPMALQNFAKIEAPREPGDRAEWAASIAYTQFTVKEMQLGLPWRHLKDEGLIG